MIIYLSIVDRHRRKGDGFVGGYAIEVPYEAVHQGQIDVMVVTGDPDNVAERWRPLLGRLLRKDEVPEPVRGDGSPL